jgi:hypothetical protein
MAEPPQKYLLFNIFSSPSTDAVFDLTRWSPVGKRIKRSFAGPALG